jgi:hypothetical protein
MFLHKLEGLPETLHGFPKFFEARKAALLLSVKSLLGTNSAT